MSRLITIISILAVMLAISITSIWYTGIVKDELTALANEAIINCDKEDYDSLSANTNKLFDSWKSKQLILSLYIRHNDLESISGLLVSIESHVKNKAYQSADVELSRLKFTLNHIYEKEIPSIDNMF